ncbi:MAG: phytase [Archangium sp.]|nr:phytase [Archangium sp.]MDP3575765.1 phytase [Archangium sp.]
MKRVLLAQILLFASSAAAQRVPWTIETTSIATNQAGDPAFMSVPGAEFIIGTDTAALGVYVWRPGGAPTVVPTGIATSADARGSVLVVASLASNSLRVFQASSAGLTEFTPPQNFNVPSPRHVALARRLDGGFEVSVDTSSSVLEQYAMRIADGGVDFTLLRTINVVQAPSGIAVDDRSGLLYVAQPTLGIMTVDSSGNRDFLVSIDGGQLGAAVGGIELFLAANGTALVLSAAPNEGELKVHAMDGQFLATLQFANPDGGPATLRPNSFDVFELPTPTFPRGVLVVQDELMANYKLVDLDAVAAVFPLPAPFLPGAGTPGPVDGGSGSDAGVTDGGSGTGIGGGGGMGSPRPNPTVDPMTPSCGCTGGPFALLPALFLLWCIRRPRRGFDLTRP